MFEARQKYDHHYAKSPQFSQVYQIELDQVPLAEPVKAKKTPCQYPEISQDYFTIILIVSIYPCSTMPCRTTRHHQVVEDTVMKLKTSL